MLERPDPLVQAPSERPAPIRRPSTVVSVLVSGGAGLIGSHLVEQLLADGATVTVLDNFSTGRRVNLEAIPDRAGLTVVETDLTRPLPLDRLGGPFSHIYHLASPASPVDFVRFPLVTLLVNSLGTKALLELAQRDRARFVLASTSEVYGDPLVHPQAETYWGNVNPIGPRSPYDESKRFAESLTMTIWRTVGVDARIARIFNTYGPRSRPDDGRLIPTLCVQAVAGDPLTVYGDGSQTRSFCYVTDLVRGLVALMETDGLGGEVINLGNPDEHTVLELAELVRSLAASEAPIVHRPLPTDDPTRRRPDIAKARRLLGWSPMVGLDDGLRRTLADIRHAVERPVAAAR